MGPILMAAYKLTNNAECLIRVNLKLFAEQIKHALYETHRPN